MATGHIRKKVNKKGEVRYQIIVETERDPITGKRERTYKTIVGTKKQAEAECRKLIAEVEAGNPVTTSAVKVSAWMDEWLSLYCPNIEATTRAGYSDRFATISSLSWVTIPSMRSKPRRYRNGSTISPRKETFLPRQ